MHRLVILFSLLSGVTGGYLARPVRVVEVAPQERPASTCVTEGSAPQSCEQVDLATRWCEARLATMQAPARLRLSAPSPEPELERQIQAALSSCAIDAQLVQTDCRELPCVVSLRLQDGEAVERAVQSCAPMVALGFGGQEDMEAFVQQWPVRCPDGTTEHMGLLSRVSDFPPLVDQLVPEVMQGDGSEGYYILGQLGRRAEQLAQTWPCGT